METEEIEDEDDAWCTEIFEPPEGWLVQTVAPVGPLTHKILKKTAKIAHRFKQEWHIGKFRYISATGADKGLKAVYYADDKLLYMHSLDLSDYGATKMWCILKKEPKKKDPEPET